MQEFEGKKLMILGGNPETVPLVEMANGMGIKTIVVSARHSDPAKQAAWKAYDIEGMDSADWVRVAQAENVDGVLVGVADILVPLYCDICDAMNFPCYATKKIVEGLSFKDNFKSLCERHGIHGIPEFHLTAELNKEDIDKIVFPVMVKPVDNGGGVGMTICNCAEELPMAVEKALAASKKKRFIVERYMVCEDVGIYYTFKDGQCSVSCVFDRHTTTPMGNGSRVNLGSIYPSIHTDEYLEKFHGSFLEMFEELGIRDGVLLICAFYENGQLYVYDPGFRLQGEAMHLLMKEINHFDQREMLIRFALTGSQGDIDLAVEDDVHFRGKTAATLWVLLKEGRIGEIVGLDELMKEPDIRYNVQRLFEGDIVPAESLGTERQVLTRLYIVSDSRRKLGATIEKCMKPIKVMDVNGGNMVLPFTEMEAAVRKYM